MQSTNSIELRVIDAIILNTERISKIPNRVKELCRLLETDDSQLIESCEYTPYFSLKLKTEFIVYAFACPTFTKPYV